MAIIHAGQLVYSRVERDRSPRKQDGFQTIFYSHDSITEEDVREIEPRLLYFAGDTRPIKRVFFRTSTGKSVVAEISPLSETDTSGRKGLYLAHALIFNTEDFIAIGANPFVVFRQFPFFRSLEDAYRIGDLRSGNIDRTNHNLQEENPSEQGSLPMTHWFERDLVGLTRIGLNARKMTEQSSTIAFVGGISEIDAALESAFLAVPTRLRGYLSFDNYFLNARLTATYYWAIGIPKRPDDPRISVVDVVKKKIAVAEPLEAATCFSRWLDAMSDKNLMPDAIKHRDAAFEIAELFEQRKYDASVGRMAPAHIIDTMCEVNAKHYERLLMENLMRHVPELLASAILPSLAKRNEFRSSGLWGFRFDELLTPLFLLYQSIFGRATSVTEENRSPTLREPETITPDQRWRIDLMLLCYRGETHAVREYLMRMPDEEYSDFVRGTLSLKLVSPTSLLLPQRAGFMLKIIRDSGLRVKEHELLDVVDRMVASGEIANVDRIIPWVPLFSKPGHARLKDILIRAWDPIRRVMQELNNAENAKVKAGSEAKTIR